MSRDPGTKAETLTDTFLSETSSLLESMTQRCFSHLASAWDPDKGEPAVASPEHPYVDVRNEIAECLSDIVHHYLLSKRRKECDSSKADGIDTTVDAEHAKKTQVFVAHWYREMESSSLDLRIKPPGSEFYHHTWPYGSLAQYDATKGKGTAESKDKRELFMPVAYWANALYEQNILSSFSVGGFSKWFASFGYLYRHSPYGTPVTGFHFEFDDAPDAKRLIPLGDMVREEGGLLRFRLNKNIRLFGLTGRFRRALKNMATFRYGTVEDPPGSWNFPLITIKNDARWSTVARRLFSVLFYSNFCDPDEHTPEWRQMLKGVVQRKGLLGTDTWRGSGGVKELIENYSRLREQVPDSSNVLVFPHYYALSMCPAIAFKRHTDDAPPFMRDTQAAPLGTLNMYTRVSLPATVIAMIRLSLQSIYQLVRDFEEWTVAMREGRQLQARETFTREAHEIQDLLQCIAINTPGHILKEIRFWLTVLYGYERITELHRQQASFPDDFARGDTMEEFVRSCARVAGRLHIIKTKAKDAKDITKEQIALEADTAETRIQPDDTLCLRLRRQEALQALDHVRRTCFAVAVVMLLENIFKNCTNGTVDCRIIPLGNTPPLEEAASRYLLELANPGAEPDTNASEKPTGTVPSVQAWAKKWNADQKDVNVKYDQARGRWISTLSIPQGLDDTSGDGS